MFGSATPVDTSARDQEVEKKLQKDKELLEKQASEEKGGERMRRGSEEDRGSDGDRRGSRGDSRDRGVWRSGGGRSYGGRGSRDSYSKHSRLLVLSVDDGRGFVLC